MERHFFEIETYLDGSMPDAERAIFEEKLKNDDGLRRELAETKSLRTDLDYHFAARDVAAAAKLRDEMATKNRLRMRVMLSLLALLLAGFLLFGLFFQKKETPNLPKTAPAAPTETAPTPKIPSTEKSIYQPPKIAKPKTQPIAGDLHPKQNQSTDLLRDLPTEEISSEFLPLFERLMNGFSPAVRATGIWAAAVKNIQKNEPAQAFSNLKNLPTSFSKNDTTAYLLAVSELLLKRPAAAEVQLYPLISIEKWKIEAQYLLVWAYLLQGNVDLAAASLKMLPDGFRDKKAIAEFLQK